MNQQNPRKIQSLKTQKDHLVAQQEQIQKELQFSVKIPKNNFFSTSKKMSKEEESVKLQLEMLLSNQANKIPPYQLKKKVDKDDEDKEALTKIKQSEQEYCLFLRRKNILETKLFKMKYNSMQKHIGGIPNQERHLNPFQKPMKPSVFTEMIMDPKMNIPQNEELFNNVIKFANSQINKDNEP